MKNIHIVNPYGTLPNEGWRKYRTNIVADYFAANGYEVTYWISNIDHRSKKKRVLEDTIWVEHPNLTYRIVACEEYSGNGSLERVKYERSFGKRVKEIFLKGNLEGDAIIITDPALFYGQSVYEIAKKTKAKFFIDILDLWPEVFVTIFPNKLKFMADFLLTPLYLWRKKLYQKADGFLAVTQDYLAVAKKNCPKTPGEVVYIGIEEDSFDQSKPPTVPKKEGERWIIYAGTLGINYDIKTILEFAHKLEKSNYSAKLLIAGDGPMKNEVEETIRNSKLQKTIFLGRLAVEELNSLYLKCDIALSTYLASSTVSMPVKAFDYIAFGLPVLNSLNREYGKLVEDSKIGLQYIPEDPESLFSKFSIFMKNEQMLREHKNNTLRMKEKFRTETQYEKYLIFVEELCRTNKNI